MFLVPLGLGGMSGLFAGALGRYRNLFVILAVIMLGLAHYLVDKKEHPHIVEKVILWIATVMTLVILAYPFIQTNFLTY
ncbi:putative mercuric transport protein, selenocysteine-containing [Dethiobacter alkaliphilus AHT 1]|uniref:Putative mercuric transport protein, selenocysteine-containing n=1 Tax=Dethiobacter alkaliphilus AHT 1 TaxID=555088 RepID=C0GKX6_DETAL|nr:putative mercuric transport protein, selenocysteine-containing [Dethiobacter alkaliphilus AHT 1]